MIVTDDRPLNLFTAAQAAQLFRIPAGSIRAWKSKGVLYERGQLEHSTGRPIPLYDRDELLALRDGKPRRTQRQPRTRRKGKLD